MAFGATPFSTALSQYYCPLSRDLLLLTGYRNQDILPEKRKKYGVFPDNTLPPSSLSRNTEISCRLIGYLAEDSWQTFTGITQLATTTNKIISYQIWNTFCLQYRNRTPFKEGSHE
jgi:hypothetical protein